MKRLDWRILGCGLLLIVLATELIRWPAWAGARNPCLEPGNLTQNCGFDTFVDDWVGEKRYLIPAAWWYFVLSGDLEYRQAEDTYWGAPSLWLLSDGVPFTAGIYQQVQVTPGVVYQSDIGWAAVTQADFERKLGLDPTGGTNPLAPTVIWGRSDWTMDRWPDLTVSAMAAGPTMTVFVWVHHPIAYGQDWIFLDAVGLWPDPNQPTATLTPLPPPTATRMPPTHTPSPEPPTATPAISPTTMPTETPSPTPTWTVTPTVTPTQTWTPTPRVPTATPYPTRTPLPTIVPQAALVAPVESQGPSGAGQDVGAEEKGLLYALLIAGGAVVMGGAVGQWLLRQRAMRKDEGAAKDA